MSCNRLFHARGFSCICCVRGEDFTRRSNAESTCERQRCLDNESDFVRHFDYSICEGTASTQKDKRAAHGKSYRIGTEDRPTENIKPFDTTRND